MARTGFAPVEDGALADEPADQVIRFLAGDSDGFDLPLDWSLIGGFHREVLKATATIPWGETASYGEVAALAGRPGAARAAGTALSRNPIALIVPCHRIIKADGSTGGYGGGAAGTRLKQQLLDLESPGASPRSYSSTHGRSRRCRRRGRAGRRRPRTGPVVLDHRVRMKHVAADLASPRRRPSLASRGLHLLVALAFFQLDQLRPEHLHRRRLVLGLGALVLALDDDSGRQVGDAHGGIGLVDVLAAGAGGAVGVDPQISASSSSTSTVSSTTGETSS